MNVFVGANTSDGYCALLAAATAAADPAGWPLGGQWWTAARAASATRRPRLRPPTRQAAALPHNVSLYSYVPPTRMDDGPLKRSSGVRVCDAASVVAGTVSDLGSEHAATGGGGGGGGGGGVGGSGGSGGGLTAAWLVAVEMDTANATVGAGWASFGGECAPIVSYEATLQTRNASAVSNWSDVVGDGGAPATVSVAGSTAPSEYYVSFALDATAAHATSAPSSAPPAPPAAWRAPPPTASCATRRRRTSRRSRACAAPPPSSAATRRPPRRRCASVRRSQPHKRGRLRRRRGRVGRCASYSGIKRFRWSMEAVTVPPSSRASWGGQGAATALSWRNVGLSTSDVVPGWVLGPGGFGAGYRRRRPSSSR